MQSFLPLAIVFAIVILYFALIRPKILRKNNIEKIFFSEPIAARVFSVYKDKNRLIDSETKLPHWYSEFQMIGKWFENAQREELNNSKLGLPCAEVNSHQFLIEYLIKRKLVSNKHNELQNLPKEEILKRAALVFHFNFLFYSHLNEKNHQKQIIDFFKQENKDNDEYFSSPKLDLIFNKFLLDFFGVGFDIPINLLYFYLTDKTYSYIETSHSIYDGKTHSSFKTIENIYIQILKSTDYLEIVENLLFGNVATLSISPIQSHNKKWDYRHVFFVAILVAAFELYTNSGFGLLNKSDGAPYVNSICTDCYFTVVIEASPSGEQKPARNLHQKLLDSNVLNSLPEMQRYLDLFQAYDKKWRISVGGFKDEESAKIFSTKLNGYGTRIYVTLLKD